MGDARTTEITDAVVSEGVKFRGTTIALMHRLRREGFVDLVHQGGKFKKGGWATANYWRITEKGRALCGPL